MEGLFLVKAFFMWLQRNLRNVLEKLYSWTMWKKVACASLQKQTIEMVHECSGYGRKVLFIIFALFILSDRSLSRCRKELKSFSEGLVQSMIQNVWCFDTLYNFQRHEKFQIGLYVVCRSSEELVGLYYHCLEAGHGKEHWQSGCRWTLLGGTMPVKFCFFFYVKYFSIISIQCLNWWMTSKVF